VARDSSYQKNIEVGSSANEIIESSYGRPRVKLIVSAIISMLFAIPLLSQSDMEYALSMQKGNKIVLLGEWKAEYSANWKQLIGSDDIILVRLCPFGTR